MDLAEETKNEKISQISVEGNGLYNEMEYYFVNVKDEKLGLEGEVILTKLYNLLGEPNQEREWKTGKGADSYSGMPHREMIYNGIKLLMIDLEKNDRFTVIDIEVKSDEYPTFHGVKVGDDINRLIEIYPNIKKETDGSYLYHNHAIYNAVFEFKDEKIALIRLYTELP
ncbi:hypothetical protein [Paenibacillus alkalitolerans]|uniref:hypothetical protein n=1 Tax=Paenibacillus alkalitolerans TaxID=2799335 RepID=UPI0018F3CFEF|nr:hypothetical protein [Paenibacillus alkalitolerans]